MRKRVAKALKILAGAVLVTGLALYLFRIPLLEQLIHQQLLNRGMAEHYFWIESFSPRGLVLRDLYLGENTELYTEKVKVSWTPLHLFKQEIDAIEIDGLRLSLTVTDDKPLLGSLHPLTQGSKASSSPPTLPFISLKNASLTLLSATRKTTVHVQGDVSSTVAGEPTVALIFDAVSGNDRLKGHVEVLQGISGKSSGLITVSEGTLNLPEIILSGVTGTAEFGLSAQRVEHLTAKFDVATITLLDTTPQEAALQEIKPDKARLSVQMNKSDAHISGALFTDSDNTLLSFDATLNNYTQAPSFSLNLQGHTPTKSVLVSGDFSGNTPALHDLKDDWQQWVYHSAVHGNIDLTLETLRIKDKTGLLEGQINLKVHLDNGIGKISLKKGSHVSASELNPLWLRKIGVPKELIQRVKSDSLRIFSAGDNSLGLNINTEDTKLTLTTDIKLELGNAEVNFQAQSDILVDENKTVKAFNLNEFQLTSSNISYQKNILEHLSLTGEISGSPTSWGGELDLSAATKKIQLPSLQSHKTLIRLPVDIDVTHHQYQFTLRNTGNVMLQGLKIGDSVQFSHPLKLSLPKGEVQLQFHEKGLALTHQLSVLTSQNSIRYAQNKTTSLDLHTHSARITLNGKITDSQGYSGRAVINLAGITAPQHQVKIETLASTIEIKPNTKHIHAIFKGDKLSHTATPALFSPLQVSGTAKLEGNQLRVNSAGGIANEENFTIRLDHHLTKGIGKLVLKVHSLTFTPHGLQPSTFSPALESLENVSGGLSTGGGFSWSPRGITSQAHVDMLDISFTQNDVTVSGLSSSLTLTDLINPASLPRQEIRIERVDTGIPIENVSVFYEVRAGESPLLLIENAVLDTLEGQVSTGAFSIDPLAVQKNVTLHIKNLDLKTLFDTLKVEGLTGSGQLTGSIPMTFTEGRVSIANGKLIANAPGILNLESETLSKILGGRASDVDLLLEALTAFHYRELTLKLDNSVQNDLVFILSILGNNPAVHSGRPFRLNIRIESNIGQLLEALTTTYGLSNRALQRALRLQ